MLAPVHGGSAEEDPPEPELADAEAELERAWNRFLACAAAARSAARDGSVPQEPRWLPWASGLALLLAGALGPVAFLVLLFGLILAMGRWGKNRGEHRRRDELEAALRASREGLHRAQCRLQQLDPPG